MDRRERPPREDRYRHQRENPSFSSTLLDSIYRSIDESNDKGEEEVILCRENMRKKLGNALKEDRRREEMESLQRAYMIEKWMEKKVTYENVAVRRKLTADFNKKPSKNLDSVLLNSSSSSSDSSSGGVFSSSESEAIHALNSRSSPTRFMQRPKPIRTSISARPGRHQRPLCEMDMYHHHEGHHLAGRQEPKHEGGFMKTRSRALKIYGNLKKVKQPISPGGRLASFLNSLFTTGQAKKAKISPSGYEESKLKSEQASTCSSASSFSRSCLSKTPSSRSKLSNGTKRSVRFYPVSVIVDEDSRPCGHKSLYESEESLITVTAARSSSNEELKIHVMNENRRVEEIARDLLKNYQNKKKGLDMRDFCSGIEGSITDEGDENDDDDAASYSSSDLFELDNLSAVGIERYREELPVYETTHLDTNRAIVNGLIL
ncbi:hypothetical protein K2173_009326 [Erythroxylum novogranatense]|uniref:Protein BIG GRAIN 1-like A n=1 Tax=Erythroxylum novogranatense TaxID=1862640 RepID=A0AAV8U7H7_9ROSI|nr:hypothetical protein K2173_009326 [Erythroxylum novogranatense]